MTQGLSLVEESGGHFRSNGWRTVSVALGIVATGCAQFLKSLSMNDDQHSAETMMRLARLRLEHEDLKLAIEAMTAQRSNPLAIQRLKKKKLELKDRIEQVASKTIPDWTA